MPRLRRLAPLTRVLALLWTATAGAQDEGDPLGSEAPVLTRRMTGPRITPRTIDFGFWGNLGYFANQDAVRTILARLWPHIRRQRPAATLFLGGADAPAWILRQHGRDGITVESPMKDREAKLRRIRVALLPLSFGSGMSNKTLEAAEAGCAIAGTTRRLNSGALCGACTRSAQDTAPRSRGRRR